MSRPLRHPSEIPLGRYELADSRFGTPTRSTVIDGADSLLNLRYAHPVGWRPLLLDLHLPTGIAHRQIPLVVYVHGGSFLSGIKEMAPAPWARLPSAGIAVASIDYRLSGEVSYPEPVEDVRAAVRFLRAHADELGLDAERVSGWGSSAGGYLVARAGLAGEEAVGRPVGDHLEVSSALQSLVLHYPVTDFGWVLGDAHEPMQASQETIEDVVSRFLGRPMRDDPELLARSSLAEAVGRARRIPPVHISHGTADRSSGVRQSERLLKAISAAGGVCHLDVVPGAAHASEVFATAAVVEPAIRFLRDQWALA